MRFYYDYCAKLLTNNNVIDNESTAASRQWTED